MVRRAALFLLLSTLCSSRASAQSPPPTPQQPRAQPYPAPQQPPAQPYPAPPPAYAYTQPGSADRERVHNYKALAGGIAMFTVAYVTSFSVGVVAANNAPAHSPSDWLVLVAPIAGPAVALYTLEADREWHYILGIADALIQLFGVAGIMLGSIGKDATSAQIVDAPVHVAPMIGPSHQGLALRARF